MKAETYYREKNYLVGKQLTSQDMENIAILESYGRKVAKAQIEECAKLKPGDQLQTDNEQGKIYLRQWNVEHSLLVTDYPDK